MNVFQNMELFKKIYDKLLSDIAKSSNITLNELKILLFLHAHKDSDIASSIVEGLSSTKSHISLSISNLEKSGYVIRNQDDADKKKLHLELTDKAEDIIQKGTEAQKQIQSIVLNGLSEEKLKILREISDTITDNLETYNKQLKNKIVYNSLVNK